MTQADKTRTNIGRVTLVGAGPGDPGLITVAGMRALQQAQVVVYDALANAQLLNEAPKEAERIDVGKRAAHHKMKQEQINALLVEKAKAGLYVVRLKGGDPYLFGRGAEEVTYVASHGIACEVIPGITAGIAAPAFAGIPVTHRQIASSVTFVTGHENPTKQQTALDYAALAGLLKAGGTLCIYMGVGRLEPIRDTFKQHGVDSDLPAALVQWGTLPTQRHVRATLETLPNEITKQGLGAPAIIVLGYAAGITDVGLDWFIQRPLFGKTILVTRTRQQISTLRTLLETEGANVLEAPTITIQAPKDWQAIDETLQSLPQYDWLILTSANAVTALRERMEAIGCDARHFAGLRIAAVGDATAQVMREELNIQPDHVPQRATADALGQELLTQYDLADKKVLMLRADIARKNLVDQLTSANAKVTDLAIYQTQSAGSLPEDVLAALRDKRIDWVTLSSSSTMQNLVTLLDNEASLLKSCKLASIGPITSQTIRDLGFDVTCESSEANVQSLAQSIVLTTQKG